jgi:hypothetical protein
MRRRAFRIESKNNWITMKIIPMNNLHFLSQNNNLRSQNLISKEQEVPSLRISAIYLLKILRISL